MGLYHNVYLTFGAEITENSMNPSLWEEVENLAKDSRDFYDLQLFNLGDGEKRFLTFGLSEIDTNAAEPLDHIERDEKRADDLTRAASILDIVIDTPNWYVLHDYS